MPPSNPGWQRSESSEEPNTSLNLGRLRGVRRRFTPLGPHTSFGSSVSRTVFHSFIGCAPNVLVRVHDGTMSLRTHQPPGLPFTGRLPDPPRYDLWPVAVRSAEQLRGSLTRCGPGVRGVGWPETPRTRAAALRPLPHGGLIASHESAAWVWGALREPGSMLHFTVPNGRRRPIRSHPLTVIHELRLHEGDVTHFTHCAATTPLRTALDLLTAGRELSPAAQVACRLLARLTEGGVERLAERLSRRHAPGNRSAMIRFQQLFAGTLATQSRPS